jgi:multiple sugar transport system permease protein
MLYQFGFISDYIAWLSKTNLAIIMLIIANLWQGTPFAVILFLSGLKSIPLELYEAARIDGSSSWQSFKYITLPLLKPIIYILIVMKTILTFKIFDLIYALTGGGPANTTQVVSMKIYNESFNFLKFGRASAMSYILLGVVTCFVIIYMKLFEEKKETEN